MDGAVCGLLLQAPLAKNVISLVLFLWECAGAEQISGLTKGKSGFLEFFSSFCLAAFKLGRKRVAVEG